MENNTQTPNKPVQFKSAEQVRETEPQIEPIPPQPSPAKPPKRFHKKWLILPLVLILAGVGTLVLYVMRPEPAKTKLTPVSVQLGWLHQAQFAGMYVAKEKGFYKEAGLDVNLKEYQDGITVNQEVTDSKSDFGISSPIEVINSVDTGNKIKAVAAIYQTAPYAIVSPKSANIKTPADFKGKTLGNIGDNPQAKVTYPVLLSEGGLKKEDAPIKPVDFDIVKIFQEKQADTADIYRTDQNYLLDQAKIEYNLLFPEQFGFDIYGDLIVTRTDLIDKNPELVRKFVQATLKGWQYTINNQEEALTVIAKYENALYKDRAYEKHILTQSVPLIKPTGGQSLGAMQFVPWNRAYEAMKSAGSIKTDIEATDLYTSQFIETY